MGLQQDRLYGIRCVALGDGLCYQMLACWVWYVCVGMVGSVAVLWNLGCLSCLLAVGGVSSVVGMYGWFHCPCDWGSLVVVFLVVGFAGWVLC